MKRKSENPIFELIKPLETPKGIAVYVKIFPLSEIPHYALLNEYFEALQTLIGTVSPLAVKTKRQIN